MEIEKPIFENKRVEDILKEIYSKHQEKSEDLKSEITRLSGMIEGAGDAIVIVPLLKGLIDSSIKNDEVLMKMAQLFKQPTEKGKGEEESGMLSEKDIAQLFDEVSSIHVSKTPPKQIEG
jgi:hypothetical protein